MGQRTEGRKSVSLDAVVSCQRFGLIRGRIIDLASGGLYVKAETSIVPIGAAVTVTFQPGEDFAGGCLSVKGRVAHQSLHGFGIEFDALEPACREVVERLLAGAADAPVRAFPVLRAI